jgi:hypothetical protein
MIVLARRSKVALLVKELDNGRIFLNGQLAEDILLISHLDTQDVLKEVFIARISQVLLLLLSKQRVESLYSVRESLYV